MMARTLVMFYRFSKGGILQPTATWHDARQATEGKPKLSKGDTKNCTSLAVVDLFLNQGLHARTEKTRRLGDRPVGKMMVCWVEMISGNFGEESRSRNSFESKLGTRRIRHRWARRGWKVCGGVQGPYECGCGMFDNHGVEMSWPRGAYSLERQGSRS